MGRIEHVDVWCPICNGHGMCLECADGLTMDAYEETQRALQKDVDRERREANRWRRCSRGEAPGP